MRRCARSRERKLKSHSPSLTGHEPIAVQYGGAIGRHGYNTELSYGVASWRPLTFWGGRGSGSLITDRTGLASLLRVAVQMGARLKANHGGAGLHGAWGSSES
jgi:hypothetical protein